MGQHKKAIKDYDNAIKLDKNYKYPWNNKGRSLYELGDYKEALKCFEKASNLDKKWKWAWYDKGRTLDMLGQYKEAKKCFEKARKSQFDLLACEGLGWVGWLRNSFQVSAENFLLAAGSSPEKQVCRIKAAEAMTLDGNYTGAVKYCQEGLSFSPVIFADRTRLLMVYAISNLNADTIAGAIKLAEETLEEFISPLHRARAQLLVSRAHGDAGKQQRAAAILKELKTRTEGGFLKAEADLVIPS